MQTPLRISPIEHMSRTGRAGQGACAPVWTEIGGMPVALHWHDPAAEQRHAETLALADLSCLPRLTVKGPQGGEFLASQGWPVPEHVLGVLPLSGGGLVARTGGSEFLLQGAPGDERVEQLHAALSQAGGGVYRVLRQDAIMGLVGARAVEALRQACAYDFAQAEPGGPVVMTRVANVSCSVLVRSWYERRVFEISTEGTFGDYLWHVLLEIVRELGGQRVGMAAIDPRLADRGPVVTQGNPS
ncbi:MAG TPA: hypothetical protein VHY20_00900 [Pirellulales bacterium]|jgi:sarcosine oxidase subunit gamma|nr:hypothetical protein [Pirellulales bacterium]